MAFWNAESEYEAASELRDFRGRFGDTQNTRRSLAEKYAKCTEGMELTSLGPWGYSYNVDASFDDARDIPIIRNVAHSLVDTLTSKIGAIDPPLPAMLTTKGSWRDRRQAADLELLVHAEYKSQKGIYATLHELWIAALRLAAGATGSAAVHFYNDNGKVGARIHDTLDMAWSDDMRVQSIVTWLPIDDAIELYPDSEADIRSSAGEPPDHWRLPTRAGEKLVNYVAIYEGWRGGLPGKPGKYVVCVKNGSALKVEDYPHAKPPIVWLGCSPHLYGPLSHCMVHHVYESMKRDNLILSRIDRAINKTNEKTIYARQQDFPDQGASLLETQDSKIVWVNDMGQLPQVESPAGFAPEHLSVADRHYEDAHNISGLAESHTAGIRQEGVDSAIGQRYVAALVNERFAALQGRFIQAVAVDSASVIIQILCDIFEEDPKMMRLAPGQDTLREVAGAVALKGIDQLKYVIERAPVSGKKGNPADRMQTAYELKQLGVLSEAGFASMQGQGFDLPEELDDTDIDRQYVDKQIYRWQFASDEEVADPGFYVPPFEYMDPAKALVRVVQGYMEAAMDDLEPERLDFFLMYIADLATIAPPVANDAQAPSLPGSTPLPQIPGIAA